MQRKRKRFFRVMTALLALWLVLPSGAIAKTIEEVEAAQEKLRQEKEDLEEKIEILKSDEEKLLEYQEALEEKISLTEQKIDTSRESIQLMDSRIGELEQRLAESKKEYEATLALFAERIKALYMTGDAGTLEILLNSTSIADFSMKMEMTAAVARHDQALLDKIEEYLEKTRQDREDLAKMRESETNAKRELEAAQKELTSLHEENNVVIADLESQQLAAQDVIAQNEEEDAALEEELQALIEQRNEEERKRREEAEKNTANGGGGDVPPVTPGMSDSFQPIWPLPGISYGNITGHFGDMYDNGPHNGLDIGADYGTPIVAAQAGQVISAEYHWSWGNNVLIWHNQDYSTRYAHCSSLAVTPGQYVEQGQTIGYVGNTGYSFGYHLHFEVYYGGSRVNPDPYLGIY